MRGRFIIKDPLVWIDAIFRQEDFTLSAETKFIGGRNVYVADAIKIKARNYDGREIEAEIRIIEKVKS